MILYIILALTFLSVFLIILFFGLPKSKKILDKGLGKLNYYDNNLNTIGTTHTSFLSRIFSPLSIKMGSSIRKFFPRNIVDSIKSKLELAGVQETMRVDIYLAIKFFLPIAFLLLIVFLIIFLNTTLIQKVALLALVPISYFIPDVMLRNKTNKRQEEIRRNLPNALDLLTISVEAGLGFDIALLKVANSIKGVLGTEFKRTLKDIEIGFSRKDALRNLSKRTDVPDLNAFIVSMVQADIFGISIGKVLRIQASEMRTRRRQVAEEKGIKAPVKLVFPLITCLFPALMAIILAPAGIRIYYTLLQNFLK